MDQNGSEWIRMDQNGSKWIKIGQMDLWALCILIAALGTEDFSVLFKKTFLCTELFEQLPSFSVPF